MEVWRLDKWHSCQRERYQNRPINLATTLRLEIEQGPTARETQAFEAVCAPPAPYNGRAHGEPVTQPTIVKGNVPILL